MTMNRLYLKALLFLAIIGAAIFAFDKSGIFAPDQANYHEKRRWDSFYEFTKSNNVDVLLIGNSHLYTGIDPNHLSCALGANCFILAAPGSPIMDSYFALKEGLKRCDPKVVVLETFGIKAANVRTYTGGSLTLVFRSFYSRKNFFQKLFSTPFLFSPDNYLMAWSESVRGHDILFKDPELVKKNLSGKNIVHKRKGMNLGRFTTFTSGITDKTDKKYDEEGAVIDGNAFRVNRECYKYVKKIQRLCDRKGIKLVFLTLPMYHKHIKNYSSWHTIVSRVIGPEYDHLDLQDPYDYEVFTKECFENTRKDNQHMTAVGAFKADYKLASFLTEKAKVDFPKRYESPEWRDMFYGEAGFFENYPLDPKDDRNFKLCGRMNLGRIGVLSCALIPYDDEAQVFMRVDKRTDPSLLPDSMELTLEVEKFDGKKEFYSVPVSLRKGIDPLNNYIYMSGMLQKMEIKSVSLARIGLHQD